VHFCAADAGVSLQDFSLDPNVHSECLLRYYEKYQPDVIWISADTWVTAQAMGAPVHSPGGNQPLAGPSGGFIHSKHDLDRIPSPDPYSQGRQPVMLEVLARMVEVLGDEVFIVGCFDQSPFSLACQVCGTENLMIKSIEDLDFFDEVLRKCGEYTLAYASAMAVCGPDMLSTGDSPVVMLGKEKYADLALPAEQHVFSALAEKTEAFLSQHICGDTTALLPHMAESGADVLEIDHQVSLKKAHGVVGDKVAFWGNIDPVSVLLQGTPEGIRAAVTNLLSDVESAGCRLFVLSSGCTLAPDTPPENLHAFFSTAREW
jgi:MtaA/CmuA family methyltransferase